MRFTQVLLHLLAPVRCGSCDLVLRVGERAFCEGCAVLLDPVERFLQPPRPAAAAFVYGGPMAEALQRLKYGGRSDLARGLGGPADIR